MHKQFKTHKVQQNNHIKHQNRRTACHYLNNSPHQRHLHAISRRAQTSWSKNRLSTPIRQNKPHLPSNLSPRLDSLGKTAAPVELYHNDEEDDLLETAPSLSFARKEEDIMPSNDHDITRLNKLPSRDIARELGINDKIVSYLKDDREDTRYRLDVSEDEESLAVTPLTQSFVPDRRDGTARFTPVRIKGRHTVNLLPSSTPRASNHKGRITLLRQLPPILDQDFSQVHPELRLVMKSLLSSQKLRHFDIAVTLTSAVNIQYMNRQYCFIDESTDTLVFPMEEPYAPGIPVELGNIADLGEIVLCVPYILANARHHHSILLHEYGIDLLTPSSDEILTQMIDKLNHLCIHDSERYRILLQQCQLPLDVLFQHSLQQQQDLEYTEKCSIFSANLDQLGLSTPVSLPMLTASSSSSSTTPLSSSLHDTTTPVTTSSRPNHQHVSLHGSSNDYPLDTTISLPPISSEILTDELNIVLIHAFLHLCGFDHDSSQNSAIMQQETNRVLQQLLDKNVISPRCFALSKLYSIEESTRLLNIPTSRPTKPTTTKEQHTSSSSSSSFASNTSRFATPTASSTLLVSSSDEHIVDILQNYNIALPAGLFSDDETTLQTASNAQIEQLIAQFDRKKRQKTTTPQQTKTTKTNSNQFESRKPKQQQHHQQQLSKPKIISQPFTDDTIPMHKPAHSIKSKQRHNPVGDDDHDEIPLH